MTQLKIMVVEDEEFARETITDDLNLKGFDNVLTVARGKEAIEKMEAEKPDFIFLDIQLADEVSGMEVLKQSKVLSPGSRCVMMSAYKDEYGQEALALGACYFLKKPIRDLDKVVKLIEEFRI